METKKPLEVVQESKDRRFLFAVETSPRAGDYTKYEELRNLIWDEPCDHFSGSRNMLGENIIHEGSSLFIGVFFPSSSGEFPRDGEHLAAFSYGYVGIRDLKTAYSDPANLEFYSQYVGIHPNWEHFNLGVRLKRFQGEIVRDVLGVYTITSTYDPLVGANAYRNIRVFGMEVRAYKEACYENFGGRLNRIDVPSDRFFITWNLKEKRARPKIDAWDLWKSGLIVVRSKIIEPSAEPGSPDLEVPAPGDISADNVPGDVDRLLVEIPYDFYALLRRTDVPDPDVRRIPRDWRSATRRAFLALFAGGFQVVDFNCLKTVDRVRDFYVLERTETGLPGA